MIEAISAIQSMGLEALTSSAPLTQKTASHGVSFEQMLRIGIDTTAAKLSEADRLVTAFAIDDTMPAHKVTFALEEARLSLELMIQIRNKMIDGYQQIMNMQV
jgi:flagellar hook-basal body complex protein FliE